VRTRRRGFTLLEVVLVCTLVVLLAVISFPSMQAMYNDLRLNSATDQVRAAWTQARVQAIDEGRAYRFAVIPGKGNYRLAPDTGEYWAGNGGPGPAENTDPNAEPPLVLEDALPRGVRFALPDSNAPLDFDAGEETALPPGSVDVGQYLTLATFLPDGTAREDVSISFSTKGGRPLLLKLRGITGASTVYFLPEGGQP